MGAAAKILDESEREAPLSPEMMEFVDHLAELLAEEFAVAWKEGSDASSGVCEVLERAATGAEHRGSDPRL